jgi:serine/threonine protein kinase
MAPLVKVLDFGIAAGEPTADRPVGLTRAGSLLGTPAYMSPEQMLASNEVDARTDVWSMGVMMYQMIAGRLPFRGASDLELFSAAMTRPPLPLKPQLSGESSPAIEQLVFKCLHKNRNERFQSMRDLAEQLRSVALGA